MQQSRGSESQAEVPEENFEDVGLNDEPKPQAQKKRGLFSRFGDNANTNANEKQEDRSASTHHFSLTGRKRAESGGGAELKPIAKPTADVPIETR